MHKMAEHEFLTKGAKIKWSGIFDMNNVYNKLKQWFDSKGYEFKETQYMERIKSGGKQLEINWRAKKKASDYFLYDIEVDFLILGLNNVEIEHEGRKITMNKGDIEARFTASLVKDFQDKWKDKQIRKNIYEKFIVKDRIKGYKDDVYDDVYNLMSELKTLLQLYNA